MSDWYETEDAEGASMSSGRFVCSVERLPPEVVDDACPWWWSLEYDGVLADDGRAQTEDDAVAFAEEASRKAKRRAMFSGEREV